MGLSVAAARSIVGQFALEGEIVSVAALAGGHINESFRVDVEAGGGGRAYLLQALNRRVFPHPDLVMDNVTRVTRHLASRLEAAGVADRERRALRLVPTRRGVNDWYKEPDGRCWRAFPFITGAVTLDRARTPEDGCKAGRAFGDFLRQLAAYDGPALHKTLPGFHDASARFARLERAARADSCRRAAAAAAEIEAAMAQRSLADVLPPLIESGEVPRRIVHNDAKIANVLLDERTGEPLCVVDLDTVMPGSALWDFGDLVRSTVSDAAEDEEDPARVEVRVPVFAALVRGYFEAAGTLLVPRERALLGFAGRLITLEQAVRFLTDHLEGDHYYRIARPGHNLVRCRAQLALFHALSAHAVQLDAIVAEQGD